MHSFIQQIFMEKVPRVWVWTLRFWPSTILTYLWEETYQNLGLGWAWKHLLTESPLPRAWGHSPLLPPYSSHLHPLDHTSSLCQIKLMSEISNFSSLPALYWPCMFSSVILRLHKNKKYLYFIFSLALISLLCENCKPANFKVSWSIYSEL